MVEQTESHDLCVLQTALGLFLHGGEHAWVAAVGEQLEKQDLFIQAGLT